jgi:hypothetical protein
MNRVRSFGAVMARAFKKLAQDDHITRSAGTPLLGTSGIDIRRNSL